MGDLKNIYINYAYTCGKQTKQDRSIFIKMIKLSPSTKLSLKTRGLGKLRYTELRVKADKALFLEILFGW